MMYGAGVTSTALSVAEAITVVCLVAAFALFFALAVRYRHAEGGILRSFKLQLSIAILVWIIGEAFAFTNYLASWSMYVHTCSMILFTLFLVYRVRGFAGKW